MADALREDFDRIAGLPEPRWSHNGHYHRYLLRHAPEQMEAALDVGCGRGELARLLAARSRRVVGVDLSPEMVKAAMASSRGLRNVDYRVADVAAIDLPPASFDCISCVATLHHLPLGETLERFAAALAPGGVLLVLDLYRCSRFADYATVAIGVPLSCAACLARTGRLRQDGASRRAWELHGAHDRYPTIDEVRAACARRLPGARVRRHLYFRYSLLWAKPGRRGLA